ncbi:MAG: MerR family transcriptional regulator [bacterium]|nr:MerR family transcriptional regulator [bacterium]
MVQLPELDQTFSISQLTAATGLSRRTIHFYVQSGMIPPPTGSGRQAIYDVEHCLRLLAIRRLKESTHLRLQGIREILDPMGLGELRELVRKQLGHSVDVDESAEHAPPASQPGDMSPTARSSLSLRMLKSYLEEPAEDVAALDLQEDGTPDRPATLMPGGIRRALSFLGDRSGQSDEPSTDLREIQGDLNTWKRITITDDLEIHFRPGGNSHFLRNVTRLVSSARRLFKK